MRTIRTLNQVLLAGSACVALFAAAPVAWSATLTTLSTITGPNVTLSTSQVTLSDSATLSGGSNPTGSITFTMTGPGGSTFNEIVTVNSNGTYIASTPLPTDMPVVGTYSWTAVYSGDPNNSGSTDNGTNEQTVVHSATTTLATSASSGNLGSTLTDSAILSGGYFPMGTITFTLVDPSNSVVGTDTVTVNGNGIYKTPAGFIATLPGTYVWGAMYNPLTDQNNLGSFASLEAVSVGSAVPEPSTWAMMLLGFAGLGFAFRQSRRKVSFA